MTPEGNEKTYNRYCKFINEIVPGHINLDKISDAVKLGVAEGRWNACGFPAIAVCDGIS